MGDRDWPALKSTLQGSLSVHELTGLQRAYEFAAERHGDTRRKDGSTDLAHVLAVTANLHAAGGTDAQLLSAGLLHDTIEKTAVTADDLEVQFGPRVAALVEAVTCPAGMDAAESARKAETAGDEGLLLRLCDRLDGVRRSAGRPPDDARRFRETTRRVHLPLARRRFPLLARSLEEALQAHES